MCHHRQAQIFGGKLVGILPTKGRFWVRGQQRRCVSQSFACSLQARGVSPSCYQHPRARRLNVPAPRDAWLFGHLQPAGSPLSIAWLSPVAWGLLGLIA